MVRSREGAQARERRRGSHLRLTAATVLSYVECPREAWFISRDIVPSQDNPFLELGRFIHETSYKDIGERSVELPGMKMDVMWRENGVTVVGEIKKSSKAVEAARAQLLYYLYSLWRIGMNAKGYILVPKERKRIPVELGEEEIEYVEKLVEEVKDVISSDVPPKVEMKGICGVCGYRELCWA